MNTFNFWKTYQENKRVLVVSLVLNIAVLGGTLALFGAFSDVRGEVFTDRSTPREVGTLFSEEEQVVNIVERVNPAVVSVIVSRDIPVMERYYEEHNFFDIPEGMSAPFEMRIPQEREIGRERREVGGGSGFFVSSNGLIITNRHVVSDTNAEYSVMTNDGETYEVDVLARDPVFDIAVLQVRGAEGQEFPALSFGDSEALQLGQTVIVIGNALGEFRNSVSKGVVSGLSRSIIAGSPIGGGREHLDEVIQTDAAINLGNSGGPMLDLQGNVVGVSVAVARGGVDNIGFALPANIVTGVVESVEQHGRIVRPQLGVRYVQITDRIRQQYSLPVDHGVLVVRGGSDEPAVVPGSSAAEAGLRENDIITNVNGERLDQDRSLAGIIRRRSVGDVVELTVLRDGEEVALSATLQEAP